MMSAEEPVDRFRRLQGLFREVLQLPAADREPWLAAHVPDASLAAQLRMLLANADLATNKLIGVDPTGARRASESLAVGKIPEQVGSFRVLGVLGHGGHGVVFKAQQQEPKREVALKLLNDWNGDADAVARFLLERSTLARMSHEAIAQVYEAGLADSQQPYLAMELVDGEPITTYCAHKRLGLAARLRLFQRVCGGVHHAHQRGVIHRDLKPGNILVAERNDGPAPKIIDFGIAAPIQSGRADAQADRGLGTLAYMAPEQVAGEDSADDVRADVYSLGVVLHELLLGVRPHVEAEAQPTTALLEALRRGDLRRPSTRLGSRTFRLPPGLEGAGLLRELRLDLDWIVLKALAREPNRRYGSAAALAEDIQRYLDGVPVIAGPPSRRYVLRKFARRHRVALVGILAVLVAVTWGGASVYAESQATRAALAEVAFRAAEADLERGDLEGSLANLGRARDAGYRDLVGLRLTEVLLRSALDEPEVAEQALRDLGEVSPESRWRGRYLLLAGEMALNQQDSIGQGLNLFEAALATGQLSEADRKYCEAMAGLDLVKVRADLEDALRLEPRHMLARRLLLPLLMLMGDRDAVAAQVQAAEGSYRKDLKPRLVLGFANLLAGEQIDPSVFDERDRPAIEMLDAACKVFIDRLDSNIADAAAMLQNRSGPKAAISELAWLARVGQIMSRFPKLATSRLASLRFHPVIRQGFPSLRQAVGEIVSAAFRGDAAAVDVVVKLGDLLPDPVNGAMASFRIEKQTAAGAILVENVDAADAALVRGLAGYGLFRQNSRARRLAALYRLLTLNWLNHAREHGQQVHRLPERAREAAEVIWDAEGSTFQELFASCSVPFSIGDVATVRLLAASKLRDPDLQKRAAAHYMIGRMANLENANATALAEFNAALALDPDNPEIKRWVERLQK